MKTTLKTKTTSKLKKTLKKVNDLEIGTDTTALPYTAVAVIFL